MFKTIKRFVNYLFGIQNRKEREALVEDTIEQETQGIEQERKMKLEFNCQHCDGSVEVILKVASKDKQFSTGLLLICPNCNSLNSVHFSEKRVERVTKLFVSEQQCLPSIN